MLIKLVPFRIKQLTGLLTGLLDWAINCVSAVSHQTTIERVRSINFLVYPSFLCARKLFHRMPKCDYRPSALIKPIKWDRDHRQINTRIVRLYH